MMTIMIGITFLKQNSTLRSLYIVPMIHTIDCAVSMDIKPSQHGTHLKKLAEYPDTNVSDTQPQKYILMKHIGVNR